MNIQAMLQDKYASRCKVEKLMQIPTHENVRLYNQERNLLIDPFQLNLDDLTEQELTHALRSTALYEKTGDITFIQLSPLGGLHARIPYPNATEFRHLQAAYATFTHGAAKNSTFYNRSGTFLTAIGHALDGSHFFNESGNSARLESRVIRKDCGALRNATFHIDTYTPMLDMQPVKLY